MMMSNFYLPALTLSGLHSSYWALLVFHTGKCPPTLVHLKGKLKEMWLLLRNIFLCYCAFLFDLEHILSSSSPLRSTSRTGAFSSSCSGETLKWPQMFEKEVQFSWLRFSVSTTTGNSRACREKMVNVKVISYKSKSFGIHHFQLPLPSAVTLYQTPRECLRTSECHGCSHQEVFHKTHSVWNTNREMNGTIKPVTLLSCR